jgi:glutathione S-transferase
MKLYSNVASPFARKCRIIIHALEIKCEIVETAARDDENLRRINPLKKIPALVLDDGSSLFDSPVICEYLNTLGGGGFFPGTSLFGTNKGKWKALGLQALADGIMDSAVACRYEVIQPQEKQNADFIARYRANIGAGLDALERMTFAETPTIGEISVACALGYIDFRYADLAWRTTRPRLAAWFAEQSKIPAIAETAPPGA